MRTFFLLSALVLAACSSAPDRSTALAFKDNQSQYYLSDRSGEFVVMRSVKLKGRKVVVKKEVFSPNELNRPLEKTVAVSDLGKIRTGDGVQPSLRPDVAQHTIWYEKKRFFSQLKLNKATKSLDVVMESPEEEWNGARSFPFPKGRVFCFFSQIPECVKAHGLLDNLEKPSAIQVIWDNFPYHLEMYEKVSGDPFEKGIWAFDKNTSDGHRYGLVLGGQLILFEFDPDKNFKNMFWVVQGISLSKEKE